MITSVLQLLLMVIGAMIAAGFIAFIGSFVLIVVWDESVLLVKHYTQSRRDTKLFNQNEEFRRDFS